MAKLKPDHLYIHYFDVDWSETLQMPVPKAVLRDGNVVRYGFPTIAVTPVDKGMLMCYNLGKIATANTRNAVFDLKELQQYATAKRYPLPLDLVFPVFGWYAWFRDNQFKRIIYNDNDFTTDTTLFAAEKDNRYRFYRDTVMNDNYFREGDLLRKEYPEQHELSAAIALMTDQIPDYQRIAFYYWNLPSINTYESVIQETFDRY